MSSLNFFTSVYKDCIHMLNALWHLIVFLKVFDILMFIIMM